MSRVAIGYRPTRGTRPKRVRAASGLGDTMLRFMAASAGYQMVDIVHGLDDEHAAIDVLMDLVAARAASAIFVEGGRTAFSDDKNRDILACRCQAVGVQLFD